MLLADAVAIEVGVGAVALLAAMVAASILGGFFLLGSMIRTDMRSDRSAFTAAVHDLTVVVQQNNTLIRIMQARQGLQIPTEN